MARNRIWVLAFLLWAGGVVSFFAARVAGTERDLKEEFKLLLKWEKPGEYPAPVEAGLDLATLSVLLEAGNLQWYEPRPARDKWDGVAAVKIHAPAEVVWEVITDYPLHCRLFPNTYLACQPVAREGNTVRTNYTCQTTVVEYSFKIEMADLATEDPPYHLHVLTVEGDVKGRELDYRLVPLSRGETLLFLRYYPNLAALGLPLQLLLKALPEVEPATAAGAANYHVRSYKNEAERRVGFPTPSSPAPLEVGSLDPATLRLLIQKNAGLLRETREGKPLEAVAFSFIAAPADTVWEVLTDFEHYDKIFGTSSQLESRTGHEVILLQETPTFTLLLLTFGYQLHNRYTLSPPDRLSWVTIDGKYEGSHGSFQIVPFAGAASSLLFASTRLVLERDPSLSSRIARSGDFPLQNMIDMLLTQVTLLHLRLEAERREEEKRKSGKE